MKCEVDSSLLAAVRRAVVRGTQWKRRKGRDEPFRWTGEEEEDTMPLHVSLSSLRRHCATTLVLREERVARERYCLGQLAIKALQDIIGSPEGKQALTPYQDALLRVVTEVPGAEGSSTCLLCSTILFELSLVVVRLSGRVGGAVGSGGGGAGEYGRTGVGGRTTGRTRHEEGGSSNYVFAPLLIITQKLMLAGAVEEHQAWMHIVRRRRGILLASALLCHSAQLVPLSSLVPVGKESSERPSSPYLCTRDRRDLCQWLSRVALVRPVSVSYRPF